MNVQENTKHVEENIAERSTDAWNYVFQVRNQNYAVMSIVEAEGDKPSAIKIFGVYKDLDEANKASDAISKENDFFNVYVADTNAWVPVPPTAEFIENVEYQESRMKEIKDSFTAIKERNAKNLVSYIKKDTEDVKIVDSVEI